VEGVGNSGTGDSISSLGADGDGKSSQGPSGVTEKLESADVGRLCEREDDEDSEALSLEPGADATAGVEAELGDESEDVASD
jgi:hypothetical protein